mmetsp:Transcript_15835/g.40729  ORF Transcript_15835/g.40729 Transcript_15835/m.40729 type:complete len:276 (-) Transcript_15835:787-1614(-)
MRNRKHSDAQLRKLLVHRALFTRVDCAGRFVEDGKLRFVKQETRKAHSLLLTTRQNVGPVVMRHVQRIISGDELFKADLFQAAFDLFIVGHSRVGTGKGVRDLVPQCPRHEIRALGHVEHVAGLLGGGRFRIDQARAFDIALGDPPESRQRTEHGRLARAVRPRHEDVLPLVDLQVEVLDENATVRRADADVLERDLVVGIELGGALGTLGVFFFDRLEQLRDARGEPRQGLNLLVYENEVAHRATRVLQQRVGGLVQRDDFRRLPLVGREERDR